MDVELFAADGTSLAESRGGPCNLYRDAEAGLQRVVQAWEGCCREAGLDPLASAASTTLSAALAGTGARSGREHFLRGTRQFRRCCLSSDAYAALIGAFRGGPGALVNVGTGTVACRMDAFGRFERRGGWGFPAGDRGGGAWLGLQVMTAWLEHRDGLDAGDDPLWAAAEAIAGTDRERILDRLHKATPAEYARVAPAVARAAEGGSVRAAALLAEATGHLVRLIGSVSDGLTVAVSGGLAQVFAPRLSAALGLAMAVGSDFAPQGAKLIGLGRTAPEY